MNISEIFINEVNNIDYRPNDLYKYYGDWKLVKFVEDMIEFNDNYTNRLVKTINNYDKYIDSRFSKITNMDLMFPYNIPPNYNIDSVSRIANLIRKLRLSKIINGFYIGISIESLTTKHGNNDVYLVKYMDTISMIMKQNVVPNYTYIEYLVGIRVNKLRQYIPNFMYTYGISNFDLIDNNDPKLTYGYGKDNVQLYVEYIKDSEEIEESNIVNILNNFGNIDRLDGGKDINILFFQTLCALLYAYDKIGFRHNDLNLGNILVVNLGELTAIPIKVPTSNLNKFIDKFIITDKLVMIIDYGLSDVNLEDGTIFTNKRQYSLIYKNKPIYNDIIYLLMNLLLSNPNNEYFKHIVYRFLSIFYTNNVREYDKIDIDKLINEYNIIDESDLVEPLNKHYFTEAILDYISQFTQYLHNTSNNYSNILDNEVIKPHYSDITNPTQLYWGTINNINLPINEQDVEDNVWFRINRINPIVDRFGLIKYNTNDYPDKYFDMIYEYRKLFSGNYNINMDPI